MGEIDKWCTYSLWARAVVRTADACLDYRVKEVALHAAQAADHDMFVRSGRPEAILMGDIDNLCTYSLWTRTVARTADASLDYTVKEVEFDVAQPADQPALTWRTLSRRSLSWIMSRMLGHSRVFSCPRGFTTCWPSAAVTRTQNTPRWTEGLTKCRATGQECHIISWTPTPTAMWRTATGPAMHRGLSLLSRAGRFASSIATSPASAPAPQPPASCSHCAGPLHRQRSRRRGMPQLPETQHARFSGSRCSSSQLACCG